MMHKAWSSIDEVPYCFSRSDDLSNFKVTQNKISTSYVKIQAYGAEKSMVWIWFHLGKIARPVAAIRSLRFALLLSFLCPAFRRQRHYVFGLSVRMECSHPKSFVVLGSAVRKMICSKGLKASPKNYYRNTTPSMASSHHWRNVWRNIAGSRPNWAQDFTWTSQKNNRTSQKNNYQHSRNFWNFLIITYHSYWES